MKILVPTAGLGPAKKNSKYILQIAKKLGAEVIVIHITDPGEEEVDRSTLDEFLEGGNRMKVPITAEIIEGNVVPTIVDYALDEKVNLIIMGASPGRLVADWVVSQVLERSQIPVVIIPYQG